MFCQDGKKMLTLATPNGKKNLSAKKQEYEDVLKVKSRKRLSLNRKKKTLYTCDEDIEEESSSYRIENKLAKVNNMDFKKTD